MKKHFLASLLLAAASLNGMAADDTGVLILADRRLLTKGYGKSFLNSLPSHTVKVRSADEIVAALEMLR